MRLRTVFLLSLLLAYTSIANAAGQYLYKYRDASGQWVLQDEPPPKGAQDATVIEVGSGKVFKYQVADGPVLYTDQAPDLIQQSNEDIAEAPQRSTGPRVSARQLTGVLGVPGKNASAFPLSFESIFKPLIDPFIKPFMALLVVVIAFKLLVALAIGVPRARIIRAALWQLSPYLKGWIGELKIRRLVERLDLPAAHDLILPCNGDRLTQVDHVVATPEGLLVLETKNYSGIILGKDKDPRWTRCQGRRRDSFQNPLYQNKLHLGAVKSIVTEVPVYGLVVFVGDAKFPNDMPLGVITFGQLKSRLQGPTWAGAHRQAVQDALNKVVSFSDPTAEGRARHFSGIQSRQG